MGDGEETLGRYRLLGRLDGDGIVEPFLVETTGAAGVVKRACLRRLRPDLARERRFVRAFVTQGRRAMALSHGNVVQVFDLGREGGSLYVVTEPVDGPGLERLAERLRAAGQGMPREVAVGIVADVCAGLHHAHGASQPLVHGDVRPGTVLLTYEGQPKLVDFGLAPALEAAGLGIPERRLGYRAPEQLLGEESDARTDVYGAGALLYALLAGRPPVEGALPDDLRRAVRSGEIPALGALVPHLEPVLEGIVMRALARDPGDRWPTAAAFQEALLAWARRAGGAREGEAGRLVRHVFASELVEAGRGAEVPAGWARRPAEGGAPRRTGLLAAGLGALALLAALSAAWLLRPGAGTLDATIRSRPSGARILIDGTDTGLLTDARVAGLAPGRAHVLRVEKDGFAPAQAVLVPGRETVALVLEPLPEEAPPAPAPRIAPSAAPERPARRIRLTRGPGGVLGLEARAEDLALDPRAPPGLRFDLKPGEAYRLAVRGFVALAFLRNLSKVTWTAWDRGGRFLAMGFASPNAPGRPPRSTARLDVFAFDTGVSNATGELSVEVRLGERVVAGGRVHPRANVVSLDALGVAHVDGLDVTRAYHVVDAGPRDGPPVFFVGTGGGVTTLAANRDEMMHFVQPDRPSAVNFADRLYLFVPADPEHPPRGRISIRLEPAPPGRLLPLE